MTEMDRVWARLKGRAEVDIRANVLLSMADARRIVQHVCSEECTETPPDQAIEFLARELVRLSLEGVRPAARLRSEHGIA